jgi:hypothetical protein
MPDRDPRSIASKAGIVEASSAQFRCNAHLMTCKWATCGHVAGSTFLLAFALFSLRICGGGKKKRGDWASSDVRELPGQRHL